MMQVNPTAIGHRQTQQCKDGYRRRRRHTAALAASKAQDVRFTAYGDELEMVEAFKYLGRLITFDDKDAQALRSNLGKARKVWAKDLVSGNSLGDTPTPLSLTSVVSRVLRSETPSCQLSAQ